MSVYLRNKVYWYKFKLPRIKEVRRSAGTASKRKAEAIERAHRQELELKLHQNRLGLPEQFTFDAAFVKWAEGYMPKSMQSHARNVRPYVEGRMLHEAVDCAEKMTMAMRNQNLSPCTINRRLSIIKRITRLAETKWEMLDRPLSHKITMLSEANTQRDITITREQGNRLLATIELYEVRRFLALAMMTGMREGEIFRLEPRDWIAPMITVRHTKGGRPRKVPLIEAFHYLMDGLPMGCTYDQLRYQFEKARASLQMPWLRIHDLRHCFATWYTESPEASINDLQQLLGHADIKTTQIYVNAAPVTAEHMERTMGKRVH